MKGLLKKLATAISQIRRSPASDELVMEVPRNPWKDTLYRLAAQRGMEEPVLEKGSVDSSGVNRFVANLTRHVAEIESRQGQTAEEFLFSKDIPQPPDANVPPQPAPDYKSPKRTGDKTITDLRSWWKTSIAAENADLTKIDVTDRPASRQLLKHWFH